MIIGVDDSGNFTDEEVGMFAAVYIRPKKYTKFKRVFESWEAALPDDCKNDGEVKGWLLNDAQLKDFALNILRDNNVFSTRHHVFASPVGGLNAELIEYQRKKNVGQILAAVEQYRKDGSEYNHIASEYEKMAAWLAKRSLKSLLKMELLGSVLFGALNDSVIWSVTKGFDWELGKLEINIDMAFVGKPEHLIYWRDIMRNMYWHLSYHGGGRIMLDTWKSNHPFLKRFEKDPSSKERVSVATSEFKNSMNFHDSKDYYEIRIADIIANAYFRHYVKHERLEAMEYFAQTRLHKANNYTIVALQPVENVTPNPYTDFV